LNLNLNIESCNYSTSQTSAIVPILQQNTVPGLSDIQDPVEKYRHDLSLRPDDTTEEDYEQIPIEEFGAAMLRGMGWKDSDTNER
jgi:hypothetical protein